MAPANIYEAVDQIVDRIAPGEGPRSVGAWMSIYGEARRQATTARPRKTGKKAPQSRTSKGSRKG